MKVALGRSASFWIVAATFVLFGFAASAPSPLYAVYAARWGFSALALTEVFAVYAIALLVALLFTGSLSDSVGRRPVILAAVAIEVASLLMFLFASNIAWLFAARVAQGFATGLATSALAAAFVDLQPPDRPEIASVANTAAPTLGTTLGALGSAVLIQYAPDPLHLVYWLMLAAFVVIGASVFVISDSGKRRKGIQLKPRIGVEAAARPQFLAALPILVAGWAVGGFYLSLGPSLTLQLAGSTNRFLGGLAIFLFAGLGSLASIVLRSWPASRAMNFGGIALVAGLVLGIMAIALSSLAMFFVANALTGIGFGLAMLGVLRSLLALAAPTARGAMVSAIFIVAYLANALPAVVAGYLVTRIGLHDAALWYGGASGVLVLAGLAGTLFVNHLEDPSGAPPTVDPQPPLRTK